MEISRDSWHYKLMKELEWRVTDRMESWPDEYCNLCYYSRNLLAVLLILVIITIVGLGVLIGGVYTLGSVVYWVGLCVYRGMVVPEVGISTSGIILIGILLVSYLFTVTIKYFIESKGRLKPVADMIRGVTGRLCIKVTLK